MNKFQGLSGRALPDNFFWMNEPEKWEFKNGKLYVTARAGANLFHAPDGKHVSESPNFLYTEVTGDFTFIAQVDAEMVFPYDSCCLVMMDDMKKYAKLCYEYWNGKPSVVTVVTNGLSDDCPGSSLGEIKPYYRIERAGSAFVFSYSLDKENWEMVRFFYLDMPQTIKVGIAAQSPSGNGCNTEVELFELEAK